MIRRRARLLFVWLGIFAVLGQLVLPSAHAQNWAQRSGNPLLVAFCGQVSPAFAQQYLEVAPPELLAQIRQQQQAGDVPLDCELCTAMHGVQLSAASLGTALPLPDPDALRASALAPATPVVSLVCLPQLRGPPSLS